MTDRMTLTDSSCSDLGVRLGKEILTDESFNVAGVTWNMLHLDLVSGTSNPITSILAPITIDLWVNFIFRHSDAGIDFA